MAGMGPKWGQRTAQSHRRGLLREGLSSNGSKEVGGEAERDGGACTVVLAEPDAAAGGRTLRFKVVNSWIRPAHQSYFGAAGLVGQPVLLRRLRADS